MVAVAQADRVGRDFVRDDGLGLAVAVAEARAEDLAGDHVLVAAERGVGVIVGVDVDQLHDPVGVAAAGRGEEVCDDVAGDRELLLEGLGLPGQHVGTAVDEALILGLPQVPAIVVDRPVLERHRVVGVGDVLVVGVAIGRGRRVEGDGAVSAKVDVARDHALGGPAIVLLPLVGAGLEGDRLGRGQLTLVLQPVGEPGGVDLLAEVAGSCAAQVDVVDHPADLVECPAAVAPGTEHEEVLVVLVVGLQLLVDLDGAVEVLGVVPAGDVERGDGDALQIREDAAHLRLPVLVHVGMRHEIVPHARLAAQDLADLGERAHLQVARVLVPGTLGRPQLGGHFEPHRGLVGVAEPESTVVVEVVADEHVGAGRLR